jgi:DNA-binding HxlR family transcriptional regulator
MSIARTQGSHCCPVEACLSLIVGRWTPLILWKLGECSSLRFGELRRMLPRASKKMLTQRLRELERNGLVRRVASDHRQRTVHYSLTPLGRSLRPVLEVSAAWAARHLSTA